jgi:hypothetical protein
VLFWILKGSNKLTCKCYLFMNLIQPSLVSSSCYTVEWMNTSFTYGDLKLHCRHKSMTWTFCSNFVILFSSTVYHVSNGIYTYKTVKGPASACMVEATHIKKEEEADVNLVAISCVLCDYANYIKRYSLNKMPFITN